MEGVVVDGDLDLAGEGVLAGADAGEHAGQVQGEHLGGGLDVLQNLGGDLVGTGGNPAECQPVADGDDVVDAVDDLGLARKQQVDDPVERGLVVGQVGLDDLLGAEVLVGDLAAVDADALAVARDEHLLALHVDELVLEGRTARVDHKDVVHPFARVDHMHVVHDDCSSLFCPPDDPHGGLLTALAERVVLQNFAEQIAVHLPVGGAENLPFEVVDVGDGHRCAGRSPPRPRRDGRGRARRSGCRAAA